MNKRDAIFSLKTRLIIVHQMNELPLLEARAAGMRKSGPVLSLIADGRAIVRVLLIAFLVRERSLDEGG